MSTPTNLPVPSSPSSPSAGSGYTHRTWLDEMAEVLMTVATIYKGLEVMDATLHEVKAGRTQLNLVDGSRATALELMTRGVRFTEDTDARYMQVFEAIQQAGGQQEVAQEKRYHDRD
ncbi:hypothetical protein ACFY4C_20915 [Actinomadura viridis]|uniref:hypothetical protein n=1 Tax=Actinomadura viridis TaxID=58110 RepID=UPI0036AF343F